MTPLYPLRLLLTGVLSWAILIGGGYLLWEWTQRITQPATDVAIVGDRPANSRALSADSNPAASDGTVTVPVDLDQGLVDRAERAEFGYRRTLDAIPTWALLSLALLLIGWSFGGTSILRMFSGGRTVDDPQPSEKSGATIARPDGSQLHVQILGNRAGPTLIFTHGWTLDRSDWSYARDHLASQYRIVLWDLPGLGQSTSASNYDQSIEKMAHDLDAVINHVDDGQPIGLVGHSIGGMITQTYARLYRGNLGTRVKALILVNTTFKNPLTTMWLSPLWTALQVPLIVPLNYLTIVLAPLAWLSNWKSYLDGSLLMFSRLTSFTGSQTWGQLDYASYLSARAWPAVVARGNFAMFEFDEEASLPEIPIPVLVIGGEGDRITQLRASQRIHELIPRSTLATFGGGHLQLFELHRQVNERIERFAAETLKPAESRIDPPAPTIAAKR